MSRPDPLEHLVSRWKFRPDLFFREALNFEPSNQQVQGLESVRDLVVAKWKKTCDPPKKMTKREQELSGKVGVSIASGHNTGKDRFLAGVYLWMMFCFPYPKGMVTGPNFSTLKSVLWGEFRQLARTSAVFGEDPGWLSKIFEIQHDRVLNRFSGGESFIEARTASVTGSKEEQGEALAGRHQAYMLLAVDEASGVPDGVFRPMEGAMGGRVNFAVLIGNMTRRKGYFYDTHHSPESSQFWITHRWDTELSNLDSISKGKTDCAGLVSFYERKYGRGTNAFRVRIQGLPPSTDSDAFIPWDWIERSQEARLVITKHDPVIWGLDVAFAGKDRTVLCCRHGGVVKWLKQIHGYDPMQVVGWVLDHYAQAKEEGIPEEEFGARGRPNMAPDAIMVDSIGIGAGVTARLRELGYPVHAVVVSEKANDEVYGSRRNELWHNLREAFEKGAIQLAAGDEELVDELSSMKSHPPDSRGVIRVFSKAEWRKVRGDGVEVNSPDKADSLMLTYAFGPRFVKPDHAGYMEHRDLMRFNYKPVDPLTGY